MRGRVLLASLLLVAVLTAGCADDGGAQGGEGGDGGDAATSGVLDGVVVDDAIRPMADVKVILDGARNATTGADGTFSFTDVAPGAHVVRAAKNGYADAVSQVIVASSEPTPLVKLVLIVDTSGLAYAEVQKIDGFVQCGTDTFNSHFAACGTFNVASFIVCAQTDVCQGNITDDNYIVIQRFDRTPNFLTIETAWTATSELGKVLSIWLGSATKEQLAFYPETPSVWNVTEGPSPLYGTMDGEMLNESGIGRDAWFLAQVFAGDSGIVPLTGMGVVFQQPFQMFFTSFFGYQPPTEWRFSETGVPPPPPSP